MDATLVAVVNQVGIVEKRPEVDLDHVRVDTCKCRRFFNFTEMEVGETDTGNGILIGQVQVFQGLPTFLPGVGVLGRIRTSRLDRGRESCFFGFAVHPGDLIVAFGPMQKNMELKVDQWTVNGGFQGFDGFLDGELGAFVSQVRVPDLSHDVHLGLLANLLDALDDASSHQVFIGTGTGRINEHNLLVLLQGRRDHTLNQVVLKISDAVSNERDLVVVDQLCVGDSIFKLDDTSNLCFRSQRGTGSTRSGRIFLFSRKGLEGTREKVRLDGLSRQKTQ
mmetsp:Transcript_8627/g.16601  ORF Transcript_8627/g.16601 Transcript_8627/m.16601 type:complete len:278 (-) Transcript_8627:168-1001(-)